MTDYVTLVLTKTEAAATLNCIIAGEISYNESLTPRNWPHGLAVERTKRKLREALKLQGKGAG